MSCLIEENIDSVLILTLKRGKVNALDQSTVKELYEKFKSIENKDSVKSVILTGNGSFFSFGFDIPSFLSYKKDEFLNYLKLFSDFLNYLFLYPKPIIAALNGHTIAGGCLISLTADYRLMAEGKSKIALNEISFGSTLFSTGVELLKYAVGQRNTELILYSGNMYSSKDALNFGLIDKTVKKDELIGNALEIAADYAKKDSKAYRSLKRVMRMNTHEKIKLNEEQSLKEFTDIWYSDSTRNNLKKIVIKK